jgi:tetrapyrrole methylase family protein/MazG family protein
MKTENKRKKVVHRHSKERVSKKRGISILEGISKDYSSLSRAYQLTQRVSRVGFDWPKIGGVLKKLEEELEELREALSYKSRRKIREEIGDLLFVLVNIARFLRIDPEEALNITIEKFISRFNYIEKSLRRKGKTLCQSNLIEMDRLWEESKKKKTN